MFDFMGTLHVYLNALSHIEIESLIDMYKEAIDSHDTVCFEDRNIPAILDGALEEYAIAAGKKIIHLDDPVKMEVYKNRLFYLIEEIYGATPSDMGAIVSGRAQRDFANLVRNFGDWEKITEVSKDCSEEDMHPLLKDLMKTIINRDLSWDIPEGSLVIVGAGHYVNLKKRMK